MDGVVGELGVDVALEPDILDAVLSWFVFSPTILVFQLSFIMSNKKSWVAPTLFACVVLLISYVFLFLINVHIHFVWNVNLWSASTESSECTPEGSEIIKREKGYNHQEYYS